MGGLRDLSHKEEQKQTQCGQGHLCLSLGLCGSVSLYLSITVSVSLLLQAFFLLLSPHRLLW